VTTKFRNWRTGRGLTLQDLARVTGRSISGLSRIERGIRGVSRIEQLRIARALGVDVSDLFDGWDKD
jgi:transcriptional regulator with XRE-family HTH domain